MQKIFTAVAAGIGIAMSVGNLWAEKGSEIKPVLVKPGKVVLEEKFEGSSLPKGWTTAKGDWQVKEGAVVGKELAADKHAAVLNLAQPFKNSVVRFSFKREGSKALHLSLNHAKGHLFRVVITDAGIALNKDVDKKDPASKAVVLAKSAEKFAPGQWYTVQVEMQGDKVVVQTDNGVKLEGSNPGLAMEKTGYRFVTQGESVLIDDLKVWEAE
jgi:hypothetical protein